MLCTHRNDSSAALPICCTRRRTRQQRAASPLSCATCGTFQLNRGGFIPEAVRETYYARMGTPCPPNEIVPTMSNAGRAGLNQQGMIP